MLKNDFKDDFILFIFEFSLSNISKFKPTFIILFTLFPESHTYF